MIYGLVQRCRQRPSARRRRRGRRTTTSTTTQVEIGTRKRRESQESATRRARRIGLLYNSRSRRTTQRVAGPSDPQLATSSIKTHFLSFHTRTRPGPPSTLAVRRRPNTRHRFLVCNTCATKSTILVRCYQKAYKIDGIEVRCGFGNLIVGITAADAGQQLRIYRFTWVG